MHLGPRLGNGGNDGRRRSRLDSAAGAKHIARVRRKSVVQLAAAASASPAMARPRAQSKSQPMDASSASRAGLLRRHPQPGGRQTRLASTMSAVGPVAGGSGGAAGSKEARRRNAADAADMVRQTKTTQRRQGQARAFFSGTKVSSVHGTLLYGPDPTLPDPAYVSKLISETGFSRRELYAMFMQFKALVALSPTLEGIDKETFLRGIPMLSLEDRAFVERVFSLLDEDGSGIIEWDEFLLALSKLTHGTPMTRASFLFDVYDDDGGGTIDDDEMMHYFLASLRLSEGTASDYFKDICKYFVSRVLHDIDPEHSGHLDRAKIVSYLKANPDTTNIGGMFGRATVEGAATADVLEKHSFRLEEMLLAEDAHLPLPWTKATKVEAEKRRAVRRRAQRDAEEWRATRRTQREAESVRQEPLDEPALS